YRCEYGPAGLGQNQWQDEQLLWFRISGHKQARSRHVTQYAAWSAGAWSAPGFLIQHRNHTTNTTLGRDPSGSLEPDFSGVRRRFCQSREPRPEVRLYSSGATER